MNQKLKVKLSKSDFFKEELEFLGHKIGIHGICPADKKLSTINRIKPPTNVREMQSIIGLLGYLNFFIPAYSEMIRHMTKLTWKNVPFNWDDKCQRSLQLAKEQLQSYPMMIYPDKSKPFHLFMDSSNFTWSLVLMQTDDLSQIGTPSAPPKRKEGNIDTGKHDECNSNEHDSNKDRPPYAFFDNKPLKAIVYHSGSFQGSQLNWSAFVKEAAAIFKEVLRMSFYLTDSEVIIHSDHKPLWKFIYALTANSRVNDWAFQIHAICRMIHFQFIKGTSNVLSDSLSRLSYYDLYEKPKPENPGFEFGKPKVEVSEDMYKPLKTAYQDEGLSIFTLTQDPTRDPDSDAQQVHVKLKKRISEETIRQHQQKEFKGILGKVEKHKEKLSHLYLIDKEGILRRVVRENNLKLEVIVVPRELTKILLFEVHEALAHPGQLKMYMFI